MFADPPGSTNYVYADVPVGALNDEIMDVAFVKIIGSHNFPGGHDAMVRFHRIDDGGVNLGDHWKHKYVVDLDGMGYSGRFFSFMESDSAVLKATVYREFFSDWLQPWCVIEPLLSRITRVRTTRSDRALPAGCITSRCRSRTPRSTTSTRSSRGQRRRHSARRTRPR